MTRGRRLQTRLPYAALAAVLLLLVGVSPAVPARAATRAESGWRVVWIDGSRIYMATRDTPSIDAGQPVTFLQSRKTLARGTVEQVLDRALAVVRLEGGSLDRMKKLDRIGVRLDERTFTARPLLRLGISGKRANALYECRPDTLLADAWRERYRLVPGLRGALDLVRRDRSGGEALWPDTVRVRRFDDVADEEIALARGELDAAVFGPGEASVRLRGESRWRSVLMGARGALVASVTRNSLALEDSVGLSARDVAALQGMGAEALRGDLAWRVASADRDVFGAATWAIARDCPGRAALQPYLDGAKRGTTAAGPWFDLGYAMDAAPHARVLATVLCPIVSDATWRPYLRALGPDAFARVFECGGGAGRP